jgi:hypothetical protein
METITRGGVKIGSLLLAVGCLAKLVSAARAGKAAGAGDAGRHPNHPRVSAAAF